MHDNAGRHTARTASQESDPTPPHPTPPPRLTGIGLAISAQEAGLHDVGAVQGALRLHLLLHAAHEAVIQGCAAVGLQAVDDCVRAALGGGRHLDQRQVVRDVIGVADQAQVVVGRQLVDQEVDGLAHEVDQGARHGAGAVEHAGQRHLGALGGLLGSLRGQRGAYRGGKGGGAHMVLEAAAVHITERCLGQRKAASIQQYATRAHSTRAMVGTQP